MFANRPLTIWVGSAAVACAFGTACSANSGSSASDDVGIQGSGGWSGQPQPAAGSGAMPIPTGTNPPPVMNPMPGPGLTGAGGIIPGSGVGGSGLIGAGGIVPGFDTGGTPGATGGTGPVPSGSGGSPSPTPTGTTPPPPPAACPAPPADASSNAVQAWTTLNQIRVAAGAGCMNLVSALDTSAEAHCNYEAANAGNTTCTSDPHGEVASCTGYTGATAQAREIAAGYPSTLAYTEVATTYGNNPTAAVPSWVDTVWHRIPLLDPFTVDMGYGGATRCDVIDIGRGSSAMPANTIVIYPYDGQTNVPPTFSGREGPAPPAPPSGWPSAYPISIYARQLSVTEHVLTKDGDATPIDHLWLDTQSSLVSSGLKGYFYDTAMLYGAPLDLSTKYRVKIVGTYAGGALDKEWTFTTAATRPFGT
jgi:uncharacterized protein YkwD